MSAPSQISDGRSAETTTGTFAVVGRAPTPVLEEFVAGLRNALGRAGLSETGDADAANLVLNVVDEADPKPFRRRSRSSRSVARLSAGRGCRTRGRRSRTGA